MIQRIYILPFVLLLLINLEGFGQISREGNPPSFELHDINSEVPLINLSVPFKGTPQNSFTVKEEGEPLEIGYTILADLDLDHSGQIEVLPNGDRIWRLGLKSEGAEALNVYFTNFYLSDRCELYIYNADRSTVLGAYTSINNTENGIFSTQLLKGDQITLELLMSKKIKHKPSFIIHEIGHVYQYSGFENKSLKNFGDSDPCEVNMNCSEGNNWQIQKRGVARVLVREGSSMSWCTGTLLNNTRNDFIPYFYTAEHCGRSSSETDYSNWIFYFNYEAEGCENPVNEPHSNAMNGGQLLAKASLSQGSDFKLLMLNQEVPANYNPYFNGWSRIDQASNSGVSIHHPFGDIKKISTYTQKLQSTIYEGESEDINGSFWKVFWAATTNGHGVTEGGSSGAPIFNSQGLVVGALTGGGASCSNLTAPDYFGKFAHSWDRINYGATTQLKPWLDPDNTGATTLNGIDYAQEYFIPSFKADTTIIPVGRPVNFIDLSIGNIHGWNWTFEGAYPQTSEMQNPEGIIYPEIGIYDVKLEINNTTMRDSLIKLNYIKVVPVISPVPANDIITVYLGASEVADIEFTLYDESGREVARYYSSAAIKSKVLNVSDLRSGFYFLRIQTAEFSQIHKIAIY